ncbi:coiled-coil domain-containing protein 81 [Exaiptasia diaphana]|uniref:Coiled-coil domain-containing protein 81 n=1 Tax=Exaiptasia diaphana TaxID=2652724 RepID=A0A913XB68_EXADI|nr:coiled-coil domain-containing protein 81 [Exaiptasia diaphana]KXJ13436.1 Coiled-coil domain-containing protein 81 [Exaiptasia diaphana]
MTEVISGLVSEAKKNKFSSIPKLSEEDIVSVWENVSQFIIKQMKLQKGVAIPGLGVFTFSQRKLDVGNNKFILMQRPVFVLSEKFAMTHGLTSSKQYTSGQIPVVQLNFAALSYETPFDRDNVESCVKEVLQALSRSIQAKRNVEFHFSGMGRLSIRDSKVKMKFYKDFVKSMDGSGSLLRALSNRPETADSVVSEGFFTPRPHTSNTLVLPRIQPGAGLDKKQSDAAMVTIAEEDDVIDEDELNNTNEDVVGGDDTERGPKEHIPKVELLLGDTTTEEQVQQKPPAPAQSPPQQTRSRSPLSPAKATAVSYSALDQPATPVRTPTRKKTADSVSRERTVEKSIDAGSKLSPTDLFDLPRTQSKTQIVKEPVSRTESRCTVHGSRGGQELCYLCHQRAEKNVPVYLSEERRRKEMEQDRLLQEYQHQKDAEAILAEQNKNMENRRYNQKVAAFNLGAAEAVKDKNNARPTDFSRSYLFQNRALTPPRFIQQKAYSENLKGQVTAKSQKLSRLAREQEFLDRLEQIQLAEDLALQREQYLREKKITSDLYKKALDTQVRFKPLPIPALEPDSSGPIFGIHDVTEEKLEEQRRRARKLYREQLDMVSQKKREAILNDLRNQKEEVDMLERTKRDIILDRSVRHQEHLQTRRSLEQSWAEHVQKKKSREDEERERSLSPGMLIHEQCDKYKRCNQCGRRPQNCGESNVWSESRYVPGSRLIV